MSEESSNDVTISVTLVRDVPFRPWWAGLAIRYEKLVGLLPSHKNTKKGRSNAKQVKVGLLAIGVLIVGFVGGWWIVPGCLLALSALILPVPIDTRRSWIAASRSRRKGQTRPQESSADLIFDGRRVVLRADDKNLRRVLTNKGKHLVEERTLRGSRAVGILPSSRKKSESIWIVTDASGDGESLENDAFDIVVRTSDSELSTLLEAVRGT